MRASEGLPYLFWNDFSTITAIYFDFSSTKNAINWIFDSDSIYHLPLR